MKSIKSILFKVFAFLILAVLILSGCSETKETIKKNYYSFNLDTVTAQQFDMGKMWTFENPPLDYFQQEYNFKPSKEWLEKAQKASLRFGRGCSASFVSEDGLIMTNHHCIRGLIPQIEKGDENFLRNHFYAAKLEDERKIPGLFVDQLLTINDVTDEIKSAMERGKTFEEKVALRDSIKDEILNRSKNDNDILNHRIVSLYNGGKYSLYGYKRYNDIRLVFAPDLRTVKLGGDYDNFTYPRHGLDCAFLRAYEDDKPVKTDYFFEWSKNGAVNDEAVFVIGNPGSTDRIKTIAQIEYDRDYHYPALVNLLQNVYDIYFEKVQILIDANDSSNALDKLIARLYSIGNSLKVQRGTLLGLQDPYLFARKESFEKQLKQKIFSDRILKAKYARVWDEIEINTYKRKKIAQELSAYSLNPFYSSQYFVIAREVISIANELTLPEEERNREHPQLNLDSLKEKIFPPDFDYDLNNKMLEAQIQFYYEKLGTNDTVLSKLTGGRTPKEAANYLIIASQVINRDSFLKFLDKAPQEILLSEDPLLTFVKESRQRYHELRLLNSSLQVKEAVNNQLLGEALFEIYGNSIPPDATGTLRISDGVIKTYEYNGTIAPPFTTFYGVLEKYYSFNKKFPFNLTARWENLPAEFNLSTPLNFISTNDIIGGNSGSPVINIAGEIVGLAFDGNIESLTNRYIYTTEANRTISVDSRGMLEAIKNFYFADRLSDEIRAGKVQDPYLLKAD